ncbi:MAG: cytochrome c4 [Ectothiorhodospiraceae bacterium]|nr:cytochrome c4 [Ectothiorhodospiraceae bacterium]
MKIWQSLAIASLALGVAGTTSAGDISRGQELSETCVACHGADGNSTNPEWPKIAGQGERYLFEQLVAYKDGTRENALMAGQVADLDEQDMRDLAAYYASQTPDIGSADPDLADKGEQIYRGGIPDKNVAACIACHGPAGEGMAAAGFPRIGGQHATYTAQQLQKYRSGERSTDANRIMRGVAERMSDDEIRAVSSYIEGLYKRR